MFESEIDGFTELLEEALTEIERLQKQCEGLAQSALNNGQEIFLLEDKLRHVLMHCEACGTLTETGICDCTRMDTGQQRLVPFTLADLRLAIEAAYKGK